MVISKRVEWCPVFFALWLICCMFLCFNFVLISSKIGSFIYLHYNQAKFYYFYH